MKEGRKKKRSPKTKIRYETAVAAGESESESGEAGDTLSCGERERESCRSSRSVCLSASACAKGKTRLAGDR